MKSSASSTASSSDYPAAPSSGQAPPRVGGGIDIQSPAKRDRVSQLIDINGEVTSDNGKPVGRGP